MENGTVLLASVSVAAGLGLWYAFKSAFFTVEKVLLPPVDNKDMATAMHNARDNCYSLAGTPREMGTNMGFTPEEAHEVAVRCAEHKRISPELVDVLESMFGPHECYGIPTLLPEGRGFSWAYQLRDAREFYHGDSKFTEMFCKFNNEWFIPANIEAGCTLVGIAACVFIFFQPGTLVNGMGFGPTSFLSKISWSDYGSLEKVMNPLPLGGLASAVLACGTGCSTVSAISLGLIRPLQAVKAFKQGIWRYYYCDGPVAPNDSSFMHGERGAPSLPSPYIGESSADVQSHITFRKSHSFVTSTALALGGFVGLKCLSNHLNQV
jgi:hypothetical protein